MHGLEFLQDMAVVMIVAGVVAILFHRLSQPVVLGYIAAGVIIGPHTFGRAFVHEDSVHTLSQLGVILLMFSLGLEFSLKKLSAVGPAAAVAAPLEVLVMLLVGYELGQLLGWSTIESIFLGAILSISSTTIVVKVLSELELTKEKFASLAFGILIVEDLLAIAMLALLAGVAKSGHLAVSQVAATLGQLAVFLVVVLVLGLLTVPTLMRSVARTRSREMLLVTSLGLCFGVSLLSAQYSVALGAFLIGAVIAETREGKQVETLIEPVRDMFTAIFFVAVGMQIAPASLLQSWRPILLISAALLVAKTLGATIGVFLAGKDPRTSLKVGMCLAQIGEFSFIIAALLPDAKAPLYQIAVAVSAITTLTAPIRIKSSDAVIRLLERHAPRGVTAYLDTYSGWLARPRPLKGTPASQQIQRLLQRWTLQIALNLLLVSGIFITAVWLAARSSSFSSFILHPSAFASIVWLTATILALPLLIASVRKLRAASMVIAELVVTRTAPKEQIAASRKVVANTILYAGSAGIFLWILILSSAILPPWPILIGLLVLVFAVAILLRQSFIRLYASAQIALYETLATDHAHDEPYATPLPPLLREAILRTVLVTESSPAHGKLIRELALRTRTGASIVGIERDGHPLINPGPDEELRVSDRVLLIGTEPQLQAATPLLGLPA